MKGSKPKSTAPATSSKPSATSTKTPAPASTTSSSGQRNPGTASKRTHQDTLCRQELQGRLP